MWKSINSDAASSTTMMMMVVQAGSALEIIEITSLTVACVGARKPLIINLRFSPGMERQQKA